MTASHTAMALKILKPEFLSIHVDEVVVTTAVGERLHEATASDSLVKLGRADIEGDALVAHCRANTKPFASQLRAFQ